jgi:hypothetical protein
MGFRQIEREEGKARIYSGMVLVPNVEDTSSGRVISISPKCTSLLPQENYCMVFTLRKESDRDEKPWRKLTAPRSINLAKISSQDV